MLIGEIIKEARIKKGWTQDELAEKVGIKSRSSLSLIEKYSRMPTFDVACQIFHALGLTPNSVAAKIGIKVKGHTG